MKKLLLFSVLFVTFLSNASVSTFKNPISHLSFIKSQLADDEKFTIDAVDLTVEIDGEQKSYHFIAGNELEYDKAIDAVLTTFEADDCTMTLTLTVTVTVEASGGVVGGSITATATGSITVDCKTAVAAGKKLRAELVAIAKG